MQWLRASAVFTIAMALSLGAYAPQTEATATLARPTHCPFKIGKGLLEGRDVSCGTVLVPKDHRHPDGQMIRIPYALFRSHSAKRARDPLFSLQGGPGGAWITILAPNITAANESTYVGDRDLVVIDQRGTGLARPSLACTAPAAKNADPLKHTTAEQDVALSVTIAAQCRAALTARAVDLNVYTTNEDAADIESVRVALGYSQINVYGVSYGTELAQVLMRDFGRHIRAVVLDSVLPVDDSLFVDAITNPAHGLAVLFAGCAASVRCNAAYPNLQTIFDQIVQRLDAHPVVIRALDPVTTKPVNDPDTGKPARGLLTGQGFAGLITSAEYDSSLVPYLPVTILATYEGKYKIDEILGGNQIEVDKSITSAMYNSVTCSEDAPYSSPAQITQAAATIDPLFRHDTRVGILGELTLCRTWHVRSVPPSFKRAVHSAIPTLLLEGAYDPITPRVNAMHVAAGLRTAYLFTFPAYGHGELGSGPCPSTIIQEFLDKPGSKPNGSCVRALRPPQFFVPGG